MELTQEYFDEKLNQLASKEELNAHTGAFNQRFDGIEQRFEKQTTDLKAFAKEQTEELARIIADTVATPMEQRFAKLEARQDVAERVKALETDMRQIKAALHIS
jgi:transketolase